MQTRRDAAIVHGPVLGGGWRYTRKGSMQEKREGGAPRDGREIHYGAHGRALASAPATVSLGPSVPYGACEGCAEVEGGTACEPCH
eukprot:6320416-Pyramimonas_sp.AAC.1